MPVAEFSENTSNGRIRNRRKSLLPGQRNQIAQVELKRKEKALAETGLFFA
jgi:hypothetical protein